jgi:multimeric flavodoxin WrbA
LQRFGSMRAVVLSAVPPQHASMTALASVVDAELARAGHQTVTTFSLATTNLAFCQGEFDCWVKTPGRCRAQDAETAIVTAVHDADALVLLGPVTFGGHGYVLKRAVDRLICLLEPFFVKRASLTHHEPRYPKPPSFFAIGWSEAPSVEMAETFAELADANALNYLSPTWGAVVVDDVQCGSWPSAIRATLISRAVPGEGIQGRRDLRHRLLASAAPDLRAKGPPTIRTATLLVGSPKVKGTSASESMARALGTRLGAEGIRTELHFATEFVHDADRSRKIARAIASRDLFVLVTPLYVDSLPSLTMHALELVARARLDSRASARFAILVNCGFPEAEHNRTALRIARHFAAGAGYAYGGGLPLGGGGVVTPQLSLDQPHGPVAHVVRALDQAAISLARSGVVTPEAIELMATPPMPDALYRLIGDLGWRWQAHKNGLSQRALHDRPLDQPAP